MAEITIKGVDIDFDMRFQWWLSCWVLFDIEYNWWELQYQMVYDLYASIYISNGSAFSRASSMGIDFAGRETFVVEKASQNKLVLPSEELLVTKHLGDFRKDGLYEREFFHPVDDTELDKSHVVRLKVLPKIKVGLAESPILPPNASHFGFSRPTG